MKICANLWLIFNHELHKFHELFLLPRLTSNIGSVDNYWGIDYASLPNREWNQKQKPKKQPWSKVECFAFCGATVRFASLETSFHAANHTIPPPPSYEGLPR